MPHAGSPRQPDLPQARRSRSGDVLPRWPPHDGSGHRRSTLSHLRSGRRPLWRHQPTAELTRHRESSKALQSAAYSRSALSRRWSAAPCCDCRVSTNPLDASWFHASSGPYPSCHPCPTEHFRGRRPLASARRLHSYTYAWEMGSVARARAKPPLAAVADRYRVPDGHGRMLSICETVVYHRRAEFGEPRLGKEQPPSPMGSPGCVAVGRTVSVERGCNVLADP